MSDDAKFKSCWKEKTPDGETVFCFRTKKFNKTVEHRYSLREIADFLSKSADPKAKRAAGGSS